MTNPIGPDSEYGVRTLSIGYEGKFVYGSKQKRWRIQIDFFVNHQQWKTVVCLSEIAVGVGAYKLQILLGVSQLIAVSYAFVSVVLVALAPHIVPTPWTL